MATATKEVLKPTRAQGIINPEMARKQRGKVLLPPEGSPLWEILSRTAEKEGGYIDAEGLHMPVQRAQQKNAPGTKTKSGAVFYDTQRKKSDYLIGTTPSVPQQQMEGGSELIQGDTIFRRPVFAAGSTLGDAGLTNHLALEAGYDKQKASKLTSDLYDLNSRPDYKTPDALAKFADKYDIDRPPASVDYRSNRWWLVDFVNGELARKAGYDSIVQLGDDGSTIKEIQDLRETTYPELSGEPTTLHPAYDFTGLDEVDSIKQLSDAMLSLFGVEVEDKGEGEYKLSPSIERMVNNKSPRLPTTAKAPSLPSFNGDPEFNETKSWILNSIKGTPEPGGKVPGDVIASLYSVLEGDQAMKLANAIESYNINKGNYKDFKGASDPPLNEDFQDILATVLTQWPGDKFKAKLKVGDSLESPIGYFTDLYNYLLENEVWPDLYDPESDPFPTEVTPQTTEQTWAEALKEDVDAGVWGPQKPKPDPNYDPQGFKAMAENYFGNKSNEAPEVPVVDYGELDFPPIDVSKGVGGKEWGEGPNFNPPYIPQPGQDNKQLDKMVDTNGPAFFDPGPYSPDTTISDEAPPQTFGPEITTAPPWRAGPNITTDPGMRLGPQITTGWEELARNLGIKGPSDLGGMTVPNPVRGVESATGDYNPEAGNDNLANIWGTLVDKLIGQYFKGRPDMEMMGDEWFKGTPPSGVVESYMDELDVPLEIRPDETDWDAANLATADAIDYALRRLTKEGGYREPNQDIYEMLFDDPGREINLGWGKQTGMSEDFPWETFEN